MATYSFSAKMWKHRGPAAWYFITVPQDLSKKIRAKHGESEEGWGRLKTSAQIGKTKWDTAIWYDKKAGAYLLPIKAAVRKKEGALLSGSTRVLLKLEARSKVSSFFSSL